MTPLFGYGTFRNPAWRRAILGADYPAHEARLHGWERAALASGYLTLIRADGPAPPVIGVLLYLDAAAWRIADAWEEVPKYRRVSVGVETDGAGMVAITYVADEAARPLAGDGLAAIDDAAVEAAIDRFVAAGRGAHRNG